MLICVCWIVVSWFFVWVCWIFKLRLFVWRKLRLFVLGVCVLGCFFVLGFHRFLRVATFGMGAGLRVGFLILACALRLHFLKLFCGATPRLAGQPALSACLGFGFLSNQGPGMILSKVFLTHCEINAAFRPARLHIWGSYARTRLRQPVPCG